MFMRVHKTEISNRMSELMVNKVSDYIFLQAALYDRRENLV